MAHPRASHTARGCYSRQMDRGISNLIDLLSQYRAMHVFIVRFIFQSGDVEMEVIFKVDECGFFIHWKNKDIEGDVLELSQVNDIRPGKCPNVSKLKIGLFFLHMHYKKKQ